MSYVPKTRFRIAEICMDEDGAYYFRYVGMHPEQGGLRYGWGEVGHYILADAIKFMELALMREHDEHLIRVRTKVAEAKKDIKTTQG